MYNTSLSRLAEMVLLLGPSFIVWHKEAAAQAQNNRRIGRQRDMFETFQNTDFAVDQSTMQFVP